MSRPKGSMEKSHIETLDWSKLQELINSDKVYGYREFCRLLNIPIKSSGSGSQFKQLDELNMICEYEKTNTKYKFIRMRNKDELFLYKEHHKFAPLIEYALTEKFLELSNNNYRNYQNGVLFFSMGDILMWCGIVHNNYEYYRKKIKRVPEYSFFIGDKHNIQTHDIKHFVDISYENILKPIIRTAIKSADTKKSIVIHKGFKVFKKEGGNTIYMNVLGTSELGRKIENIIANVYTEYSIKSSKELFTTKKHLKEDLYQRCNELCKVKLGYDGFYDCYAIVINKTRSQYNLNILRGELNNRVKDKFETSKHLDKLNVGTRKKLVGMLVDLQTDVDFQRDIQEYVNAQLKN